MTDLEHVQQLIKQHGNPRRAAIAFNQAMERAGLEYRMDLTSTMQRVAKGEAKPAMVALIALVLDEISGKKAVDIRPNGADNSPQRSGIGP